MKNYVSISLVVAALFALLPQALWAQTTPKTTISGLVRSPDGAPVEGAVVRSDQDAAEAVTDATGAFSLETSPSARLTISAPGFQPREVDATAEDLTVDLTAADALVQVAYRQVDSDHLPGAVSVVNLPDILDENYITYPLDGLEAYAGGFNGNLWGMTDNLVLIDGVPREIGSIMPTEIEQITFLKGVAAVALYGSRGAKGVIAITTKKGRIHDRQQIRVRANTGQYVPKQYPKYLGSAEYMTLYNEARRNDGLEPLYSDETIYNYAAGLNPYRYPNVNYYSPEYLKKTYNRSDATMEISGGNAMARYYTNVGFWTEGSLMNFGEARNNYAQRFNIRGNVDIDLNDYISCEIGAAAIYYNGRGVNTDYWNSAATLRPYRFAPLIPISMVEESDEASQQLISNSNHLIDGQYLLGGTQLDQTNPFAATYAGGYNKFTSRQFQFNTGISANLRNLLKGLTFQSRFGVDYQTSYNQSYNNNYAVYQPTWNTYAGFDQISSLTKYGQDSKSGVQNISGSWYGQTVAFSGQFNYQTTVRDDHHLSAMLIAAGFQQARSAMYHKTSNANLGLHLGYDFRNKYFVDFNGALVHSAKLPKGNRMAPSPSVSLGWLVSEEGFLKSVAALDHLKLYASAGVLHTDLDIDDYYLYQSIYTQTDGSWYSWRDGALNRSTDSRRGENPDLTFARREELNLGLEASLFNRALTLNGSVFANKLKGNVVQASVLYPSYFATGWPNSSFIPYVNYDDDQRIGFDFNVNLNRRLGQVDWTLGLSGMYFETKATKRAEMYENAYQNRAGKPLDAIWGLESEGFFRDEEDILNATPQAFGEVKPGDLKYKDQNGDGVIDTQDEVYLGRGGWFGAPLTTGVHLTAKWKNFTLFALGVGRFGAQAMKDNAYFWVDGEDKYSVVVRDRWTEATAATATYPRLTTLNSNNNFRASDFWLYSTNRFDLAKVQLSYQLPAGVLGNKFLRELGVYVSGANLLTLAPEREMLELNVGSAPQTRFYNLGVKALF
ncbi:TonB-linked outer membrane protein, SusC/RagA family [Catalinimonas alkaloidigena]|uniref:TonB-linked outer membrane protein, SusC/RagA family n=1 Tax=Catalinimonas alkaloidigena TaxID=1075417 RepID=A0A1G9HLZ6_9BACT|nr:SusC/RagA family TonB-linked outer membrane protein [Catalinimonas alkaloidigena]SDL13796.1 TonB-linked outer membrane protein, SusC/RagA family [Catalinimonas alkaloidigena]